MKIKGITILVLIQYITLVGYAQQTNQTVPAKSAKGNSGSTSSQTHELKRASASDNKSTNSKQPQLKRSEKAVNNK